MKKVLVFLCVVLASMSCSKTNDFQTAKSSDAVLFNYQIVFDRPTSYSGVQNDLTSIDGQKVFVHTFESTSGTQFRGFIPVSLDQDLSLSEFRSRIDDGMTGLEFESEGMLDMDRLSLRKSENVYDVSEILVSGSKAPKDEVANTFPSARVIQMETKTCPENHPDTNVQHKMLSSSLDSWIPDAFAYNIAPSSSFPGKRFLATGMIWTTQNPFGPWSSSSVTFEPDFNLNNHSNSQLGPGTYLDNAQYINGVPNVVYAASSLPLAYLDTRDLDPNYVKTFTIGCPDATQINHNTIYLNYIVTNVGNTNIDNAGVVFQRGYIWPSWMYNTWSVFSFESHKPFSGSWPISVPGSGSWSK